MDETGADYTERSKPERKTPIQCTNTYIWNLERWHTYIFKFKIYSTSVLCYTESESMMPKSHHVHDESKWKTMAMLIVGGNIELHYVPGGHSW